MTTPAIRSSAERSEGCPAGAGRLDAALPDAGDALPAETALLEAGLPGSGASKAAPCSRGFPETHPGDAGLHDARLPAIGLPDGGLSDASDGGAPPVDTAFPEAGLPETTLPSSGAVKAAPYSPGLPEARSSDTGLHDAPLAAIGLPNGGLSDASDDDAPPVDTAFPEAGLPDTTLPNSGAFTAAPSNAGLPEAPPHDAGLHNARPPTIGVRDIGHPDAGIPDRAPPGARHESKRILVIKLGALGDLVLAFAPFAAIRAHHPQAHLTLLTTQPFLELASASPWFDAVTVDERPRPWNLSGRRRLRAALSGFDFIYDLQTSGRSTGYHRLAGRPPWSGIARGATHSDADPNRDLLHTRVRQAGQLRQAGIDTVPDADLRWLATHGPRLDGRIVLLVPGAAPHRPRKRWPADRFGQVACSLLSQGLQPVVVGSEADQPLAAAILEACPDALDLTGRTSLVELGGLCSRAVLAVGNDTGPMHLAAAMGCACLSLFSGDSDPALTAPVGTASGQVAVLRVEDLNTLSPEPVLDRLRVLLAGLTAQRAGV